MTSSEPRVLPASSTAVPRVIPTLPALHRPERAASRASAAGAQNPSQRAPMLAPQLAQQRQQLPDLKTAP